MPIGAVGYQGPPAPGPMPTRPAPRPVAYTNHPGPLYDIKGNVIETASTRGDFRTDVCSACHPFYTGKQKRVAVAGWVEKFNKKYKRS